mgnify:CR=1 FL=1
MNIYIFLSIILFRINKNIEKIQSIVYINMFINYIPKCLKKLQEY